MRLQGPAGNTFLATPGLGGGRSRGFQADSHPGALLGCPNFPLGPPSPMVSRAGGFRVLGLESPSREDSLIAMACQVPSGRMCVSAEPGAP